MLYPNFSLIFFFQQWKAILFLLICISVSVFIAFLLVFQNNVYDSRLFGKLKNQSKSLSIPKITSGFATVAAKECAKLIIDWDSVLERNSSTGLQLFQYFMWTNRSSCQLVNDFGGVMMGNPSGLDGQKSVCIDPEVAPEPDKCLVYSFGIKNEWSFDEQMELYGCEVFAFDPSMGMQHHEHSNGIHFYNWGLGDEETKINNLNWTLRTLSSIYETLSERHGLNIIDYLKIDIEYSEWTVLPQIIRSGMLSHVRQLGVEIHLDNKNGIEEIRNRALLLRKIEKMGMVRFDSKKNPWFVGNFNEFSLHGSLGYEIAWYNSKLIKNISLST